MKKNNVTTTATKQRKQLASKARRKRRVAARAAVVEAKVKKQLRPLAQLVKAQEKQIEQLKELLATPELPLDVSPEVSGAENV